jgi:hypothetical protein
MTNKPFKWKSFISFGLFISFFIIAFTGIILYITPPGRVAKWVDWRLLGLTKEQWQAQHTIFAYTFFILSIFHIFTINWKVFLSYIKTKASKGFHMKREFRVSLVLILVIFFGTLFSVPPFKTIMDVGEYFTESWEKKEQQAPMPHTEAMSIRELSEKVVKQSPGTILEKLRAQNVEVASIDQTLKDIGKENNRSPYELYKIISENTEKRETGWDSLGPGSGIGKKTLEEVAEITGGQVSVLIDKLKAGGIDASPGDKIKDIAARTNKTPYEIIDILKK